uniref:Uncharacterized protein n=1 Tax=viral metagenome TaxID=1070528 RepID=A0A6H2A6F8_9ZZZZ
MSEGNGNEKLEPIIPVKPVLSITFLPDGKVEVNAPGTKDGLYDILKAMDLMFSAYAYMKDHNAKVNMPKVQIHKSNILNRMGGAFGKHK